MPTVSDYLSTLDICLQNLPADAHPAHAQRIRMFKELVQQPPQKSREEVLDAIKRGLCKCGVDQV